MYDRIGMESERLELFGTLDDKSFSNRGFFGDGVGHCVSRSTHLEATAGARAYSG
jgi:hypothetical protein